MVSVADATEMVFSKTYTPGIERIPLAQAVGRVLAVPVVADRDLPPFDRVAMDGIAIAFEAWTTGQRTFPIDSIQAAGQPPRPAIHPQRAVEVMTGAILPAGTDTVIRYEDIDINDRVATIRIDSVARRQNIHAQGADASHRDVLLQPGFRLAPAEIAVLASVGMDTVPVRSMPKAAVISSGDELVAVEDIPALHQIRRSNTHALEAAMRQLQWPCHQYHLHDQEDTMINVFRKIIEEYDVLIISGGVSKGKFDFMPSALEAAGIKKIFHQVSQRPGKPFWFGSSAQGKTAFALPGNPVSTYMCFYRYITPWLWKSLGVETRPASAILAEDFSFAPPLTHFLQVRVTIDQARLIAYPQPGGGSGDFANLKTVDGFLELPPTPTKFQAGTSFPYYPFR